MYNFDKKIFFKYFTMIILGLATGFTIANIGFGYEMMPFDIPGSILTSALLANLLMMVGNEQEG